MAFSGFLSYLSNKWSYLSFRRLYDRLQPCIPCLFVLVTSRVHWKAVEPNSVACSWQLTITVSYLLVEAEQPEDITGETTKYLLKKHDPVSPQSVYTLWQLYSVLETNLKSQMHAGKSADHASFKNEFNDLIELCAIHSFYSSSQVKRLQVRKRNFKFN